MNNTSSGTQINRQTILITHANPEDNLFARWLAARLISAGYRVWLDLSSLTGASDFWSVIEDQLRNHAVKQIVLVSQHVRKSGVLKELALGDYVGKKLGDAEFMIPIRVSSVPHGEFPTELLRRNSFDAFPNWASVLQPLLKTLVDANVPFEHNQASGLLTEIIAAQEAGRLALKPEPEVLLTNWFEFCGSRPTLRFYSAKGTVAQVDAWLKTVDVPYIKHSGLIGTFSDFATFVQAGQNTPKLDQKFEIKFDNLISGQEAFPFPSRDEARRSLTNLVRQHWDHRMKRRGLTSFEFASGQKGWFFPDGLVEGRVKYTLPNDHLVDRVLSGKFKERRWHLCLVAQPRHWPSPMLRIHANVALSDDGHNPLPGIETQKVRRRLTRSWWNDKWRDLLFAGMGWLSDGNSELSIAAGTEAFSVSTIPITSTFPFSYQAAERRPIEENELGDVELSSELDADFERDFDDPEDGAEP